MKSTRKHTSSYSILILLSLFRAKFCFLRLVFDVNNSRLNILQYANSILNKYELFMNNIVVFFYFNIITKKTLLKTSSIAIFGNMNNITCELIFTTRQTMQRGFAPYSDVSRHCVNSSCAQFSFVFFQCLQIRVALQYKSGMLRKLRRYFKSV